MVTIMLGGVLVGALLALRYRALILVPLVFALMVAGGVALALNIDQVPAATLLAATAVQLGYFAAAILYRFSSLARASTRRHFRDAGKAAPRGAI